MVHDLSLRGAEARSAPVATLCAMFDHAVATAPDNVALRHSGVVLTYREVGRAVAALANHRDDLLLALLQLKADADRLP